MTREQYTNYLVRSRMVTTPKPSGIGVSSAPPPVSSPATPQVPGGISEWQNTPQTVLHVDVIPETWDEATELFIQFRVYGGGGFTSLGPHNAPALRVGQPQTVDIMLPELHVTSYSTTSIELFATVTDKRYQVADATNSNAQTLHFKVSQSLVSDAGRIVSEPREWHPEELKLLTSAGGQISIDYSGYSGSPPTGNVSTRPAPLLFVPPPSIAKHNPTPNSTANAPRPTVIAPSVPITIPRAKPATNSGYSSPGF
jgi:hypothetical protein